MKYRFFDLFLIFIFSPILLATFFLAFFYVFIATGFNPFFLQVRLGKSQKLFTLVKFRTIKIGKEKSFEYILGGKFIRAMGIDEIPSFINILRGEMSLVGPRPLLPEYRNIFADLNTKRHEILPGLTGWAQINGRDDLSLAEKCKYDDFFVLNMSVRFYFYVLWLTIYRLIRNTGGRKI